MYTQTAPVGTPSAQAAARAASSEDRAALGRGIDPYVQGDGGYPGSPIPKERGDGGYPGGPVRKARTWHNNGDPDYQVIRRMVGFDVQQHLEVYFDFVKPVNKLGVPILELARENQRKFQVTYGVHNGVETFQNGPRSMPEETVLGVYQGDLYLEAVGKKVCPVDPQADTSHDIDIPFRIGAYTCFLRGRSEGRSPVNAALFGHACDTPNAEYVRCNAADDTSAAIIECDPQSGSDEPDGDDLMPEDGRPRNAEQILARQGVVLPKLDDIITQCVITAITTSEVGPYQPLFTTYNSEDNPKDIMFWREDQWDGTIPPGHVRTMCMCAGRIPESLETGNERFRRFPDDPSKWSNDPENWISLKEISAQDDKESGKFKKHTGGDFEKDGGQRIEETLDLQAGTVKSCQYGRWRFDKVHKDPVETAAKQYMVNFLLEQRAAQQAKLDEEGLEAILDSLRACNMPKKPQVIYRVCGYDISDTMEKEMIEEINAKVGAAVELARQNHVEHATVLCIDPNKIGGSRLFNGGGMMGGNVLLGFNMGVVMPSSKVPLNYMSEAFPLPVWLFNEASSLVAIRLKNDPLDKLNAANFGHSCLGDLTRKEFSEHKDDRDIHETCIGKWLYKRLQSPLDCLSELPVEHQYNAADFLSLVYTLGYTDPLKGLDLNRKGDGSTVARVVEFTCMKLEWLQLPEKCVAVPCDCNFPRRCAKNSFVVCNGHIDPDCLTRPNQYDATTTVYDNKPSRAVIDDHSRAMVELFNSGKSYQDTLVQKSGNPPRDVVLSMAQGPFAFKGDEYTNDVEESSESSDSEAPVAEVEKSESQESEEEALQTPRRGGRRVLSDDDSSPDHKRPKATLDAEPIESAPKTTDPKPNPTDPKPNPTDPNPNPTDPKPNPTDPKPNPTDPNPTDPTPKPAPAERKAKRTIVPNTVRGKCPKCGLDVTTDDKDRIKVDATQLYWHKECYDTRGD